MIRVVLVVCFPVLLLKRESNLDYLIFGHRFYESAEQVDVVLGKNENGFVSAYAKNYKNGGKFIQAWFDQDAPSRLDAILKLSEWRIE